MPMQKVKRKGLVGFRLLANLSQLIADIDDSCGRGMERIIDRVGYCGQWVRSVDICQCAPGSAFEIGRAHLLPIGGNAAEPSILPGKETH